MNIENELDTASLGAGEGEVARDIPAAEPVEKPKLSLRDELKAGLEKANEALKSDAPVKSDKARDESGKFAKADPKPKAETPPVQAQPEIKPEAAPAPSAYKPPPGWSTEAKADFDKIPSHVQAAIAKREAEIDNGFKVLQDYKGLDEFTPIVRQAGTTHAAVMKRAVEWERALATDPVNTVVHVARLAGVDLAALVAGRPQRARAPQPVQQQPVNIESTVEQILSKRETEKQVQAFLDDPANVHASNVIEDMVALIKAGRFTNLKDAYEAACYARPDIRETLINQRLASTAPQVPASQAADQARRASKSINGSSAPGASRPASMANAAPKSTRELLREAFASQGNRA